MKVLVTGAHGFLGKHVCRELRERGHDVLDPIHNKLELLDKEAVRSYLSLKHYPEIDAIIHLAAICGGIGANRARPAEFFYDNLVMGVELLHAAYLTGIKKFVAIGTVCFPAGTKVITDSHVESIENVKIGQRVLTDNGSYQKVSQIMKRPYNGSMVNVHASGLPLMSATPEHPFLVKKKNGEKIEWKTADSLEVGDFLITPILSASEKKDNKTYTKSLCELFGIFVAEGSVYLKDTGKRGSRGSVYFSFGEEPEYIARTEKLMKDCFGLKGTLRKIKGQKGYQLYFYHLPTARFFAKECYPSRPYLCHNIIIPEKIFALSTKKIAAFLKGYFEGDGCYSVSSNRRKINFTTVSEKLVWQLRLLLGEIGLYGHIQFRKRPKFGYIQGRKIKQRDSWAFWITGNEQIDYFLSILKGKKKKLTDFRVRFRRHEKGYLIPIFSITRKKYV